MDGDEIRKASEELEELLKGYEERSGGAAPAARVPHDDGYGAGRAGAPDGMSDGWPVAAPAGQAGAGRAGVPDGMSDSWPVAAPDRQAGGGRAGAPDGMSDGRSGVPEVRPAGRPVNRFDDLRDDMRGTGANDLRGDMPGTGMNDLRGDMRGTGANDLRGDMPGTGMYDLRGNALESGRGDVPESGRGDAPDAGPGGAPDVFGQQAAAGQPKNNPGSRSKSASRERRKQAHQAAGEGVIPLGGNAALFAGFMVPVVIMIVIFVQRGIFPFGEKSFLRTDMYHQYAPFFSEFQYKLTHGGSLLYSWDVGMGVNFSALFAYYLASPLNWLLVLCPKSMVIEFMTYMIVLKIGLAGLSFTWYLRKHFGTRDFGAAFFGIFYALSGYMAAYSWNIMWLDCILLFPLVMLGLERLVKERRGLLYCVTLGICILSNYYISIMICIFMVIYFAALLILEHRKGKGPAGYLVNIVQFGCCSLAAGGLAAVVLLPELYALQATASSNFSFPKTASSYFSIFDMFARHIGNIEVEIGLDHWPNIYCGVAVLMFFLLYLGCRQIPARRKAVYCGMLLLFYASFSVNVLNFIWHGFHYPNSLPCRQSFIYIVLMLSMCYEAYSHLREIRWKQVAGSFFGAVCFVILAEKLVEQEHFQFYVYYVAILFLALYAGILYLYKRTSTDRSIVLLLALAVVAVEAAVNTTVTSVTITSRTAYVRDNEDVRSLVSQIPSDEGFYRVEKVTRKTKNDGAWMNFPSVSLFSSTANADMTAFFKQVGCEGSVNAYSITGSTPLVDSLFAVRYGLYSEEQDVSDDMLQLVDRSGDTWLYRRYFTLPLGFMLPDDLDALWDRTQSNPALVQNDLSGQIGAGQVLLDVGGENMGDNFQFTVREDGEYYVYISNRQVEKVNVKKGSEGLSFDNVSRGYLLELGRCEAGQLISVNNEQEGENLNAFAYRFSNEALRQIYDTLDRHPFEVTGWTDTTVDGVVQTDKDGVLFTSIPYDEGWTVAIDGETVETEKIFGAFLSVPVSQGAHTVSMRYMPQGLEIGAIVSVVSVLLVAAAALAGCAARRRKRERGAGAAE